MPSADQVLVKTPQSTMQRHEWVVLIAGSTRSALRAVRPPNLHITPDTRRDLVHAASAIGSKATVIAVLVNLNTATEGNAACGRRAGNARDCGS